MKAQSLKQEQELLTAEMRRRGCSWVEVAREFQVRYRYNARVAFRVARGWSQARAAEEWNRLWPDDRKTLKSFSYWEQWPAPTGHAPSLHVLVSLAQLYQCAVADLLADCPDFRYLDDAQTAAATLDLPTLVVPDFGLVYRIRDTDLEQIAQVIMKWTQRLDPKIDRRSLLLKVSAALALAACAPAFDAEQLDRIAGGLADPSRLDLATLTHAENVVRGLDRQANVLGPGVALQTAMELRQLSSRMLREGPSALQQRALRLDADVTLLVGYQLYNLGDHRSAQYYYDVARATAHDAGDVELVTQVLCLMSQLATWQGKPRVGIDHATAATTWARHAADPRARAHAANVAARAYAADHQPVPCHAALDREHEVAAALPAGSPASRWWFYDASNVWGATSKCALELGEPARALEAAGRSLTLIDPGRLHDYAFVLTHQSEARIQLGDLDEAGRILGDVAQLTTGHSFQRIDQRVGTLRRELGSSGAGTALDGRLDT